MVIYENFYFVIQKRQENFIRLTIVKLFKVVILSFDLFGHYQCFIIYSYAEVISNVNLFQKRALNLPYYHDQH